MKRPECITSQDLERFSNSIDQDPFISLEIKNSPLLREVCYAGLYLAEELEKLNCPSHLIVAIQYSAGQNSFGNDIWETHLYFLKEYKLGNLEFEDDK